MTNTVRLVGGTGNQLFGWAFGLALSKFGSVQYDVSAFDSDPARMYMLDKFGLNLPLVNGNQGTVIHEDGMPFDPKYFTVKDSTLFGYFQSERYFESVKGEVYHNLSAGMPLSKETWDMDDRLDSYENSVSLHVRRSDNLSKRALMFHGLLDGDYYRRAQEYIREHVRSPHFFIFSEDHEWCHQNMSGPDCTIVDINTMSGSIDSEGVITKQDGGTEYQDFYLMSRCKHSITANSTFSWWAAWFGDQFNYPDYRVVVAPRNDIWFVPTETSPDPRDVCPERWVRL